MNKVNPASDSETDRETCDHADPAQWRFYVVPTTELPDTNTLMLATLERVWSADDVDTLPAAVEAARRAIKTTIQGEVTCLQAC